MTAYKARALVIGDDLTFDGGGCFVTPAGALDNPSGFIKRLAVRANQDGLNEMTIMLESTAAKALGLPQREPRGKTPRTMHPVLEAWRADGWRVSELQGWTTLWAQGRTSVHLGVLPWLGPKRNMLHHDDPGNLAYRLRRFQQLTGAAFHGNPGLPALALIRDTPLKRGQQVYWQPKWVEGHPVRFDVEKPFHTFHAPVRSTGARIGVDARRQYLAAARNVRVALGDLQHTGPMEWDPKAAGYWRIVAPAWNIPELPNPSGYRAGAQCWVTTDTMQLLSELDDAGVLAFPAIQETWTSTDTREFLRPWADHLDMAFFASLGDTTPDGIAVNHAIKGMYSWGTGMMRRRKARVARGDWHHAIIAKARCNFYRRLWQVYQYMGIGPDEINYDTAWYPQPHKGWEPMRIDPQTGRPGKAFPEGMRLGQFEHKYDRGGAK